ncbi:MAG TPA: reverse transcriptase domain-containing protein [Polyangiaceae bacterium]|nr:reverse transcriptase domain-containing protein [Polyangiaceae bacterium]
MPHANPLLVLRDLAEPRVYERELKALVKRHAEPGRKPWSQSGLLLADWDPGLCARIAKQLARDVPRGDYRFGVFTGQRAVIGGKERTLYRATITDAVVSAVLARSLRALSEPALSSRVYSYRPGRSALLGVRDFAAFVRAHREAIADPRARGLFVLRRDVARYGESIPVDEASPLWPLLAELWQASGISASHPFAQLTEQAIRPLIKSDDGGAHRLERGVPTGSPIQPVICNLYLSELDRSLESLGGGFYARYGDDILFAHANQEIATEASARIERSLASLGLSLKAEKVVNYYFTGCGRSAGTAVGTTFIEYLGLRVAFTGAVGLPTHKARRLLRNLWRRAENTKSLSAADGARSLDVVCGAVRAALDVRQPVAEPLASHLRSAVDDRAQLRHLDYLLALGIARRLAGKRGVRAFRKVSYASLRRSGLPSLIQQRNFRRERGKDEGGAD